MGQNDFWNNREKAQEVVTRLKGLKAFVKPLEDTVRAAGDVGVMIEMAGEDESMAAEVPGEIERLEKALDDLETKSLLSGPLDPSSALVSINARDGGTDAHDWAEMLLRMYLAWARDHDYDTEILDRQDNEEAGINSAAIAVRGPMAYGYLKGEAGIHRLVRISPFNAEGKRQTSFAAVDVSPEVSDEVKIEIRDEDLEEKAIRSSGPGGQHVNKTSSAIQLRHLPTGILICCQAERSQHKNRAMALKMLRARLARIEEEKREVEQAAKYTSMPKVGFGSQIRSYFLHPDQRVKDSRTGYYMGNFNAVLDGNIQGFLDAYLRYRAKGETYGSGKDDD
jgi:peptide chain release factor 2